MRKIRQNGFILILVITAMAVIGILMFVLAGIGNTMQFQSHTAYLQACERNLVASGLAWARQNIRNKSCETLGKTIELDVTEMDIRGSALDVMIDAPAGKQPEVQIKTSCSRGRQTLRLDARYEIDL